MTIVPFLSPKARIIALNFDLMQCEGSKTRILAPKQIFPVQKATGYALVCHTPGMANLRKPVRNVQKMTALGASANISRISLVPPKLYSRVNMGRNRDWQE